MTRADKKFHRVIREFYDGKLKSSSGKRVRDEKQALAIAFSEARTIDPKYKIKKYENGTKIKIDNTLQLIFEDAWQHYLNYISTSKDEPLKPFSTWLQTTNDGLKYNKRMAQLIRENENEQPIMNKRGTKISNNDEHRGGKLSGESHDNGGIRAVIVDSERPVELENDELVITRGVAQSTEQFICAGHPEAIASELNIIHGGDKISDKNATCHLKQEIMERGKKLKSHLQQSKTKKIQSMIIRDNELKNKQKMAEGAKIIENVYFKINEPKEFEILECIENQHNFRMQKYLKTSDILIMKKSEDLEAFLDKFEIHYVEFESKTELDEWLKNQLPKRIQNKIQ